MRFRYTTLHYMSLVRRFYPKRLTYSILWPQEQFGVKCLAQGHNDMLTAVGFEPVTPWSEHQRTTTSTIVKISSASVSFPVCSPPTEPENGGYRCHPSPCPHLAQKTVIEYFCDEGYALKGDYKFLTCQNGEWDGPMQISCRLTQGRPPQLIVLHLREHKGLIIQM